MKSTRVDRLISEYKELTGKESVSIDMTPLGVLTLMVRYAKLNAKYKKLKKSKSKCKS